MKIILNLKNCLLSAFLLIVSMHCIAQNNVAYATVTFIGDIRTHDKTRSVTDNLLDDMLTHANIFIDSTIVCKLAEQRYSVHNVATGTHVFSAQFAGKKIRHLEGKSVDIEAGKNYFFQVYAKDKEVYLVKISEDFAQKIVASLKLADCHIQEPAQE